MTSIAVAPRRPLPGRFTRWGRPLLIALVAVLTLVVLAIYVFPTRTWIDQRVALAETEAELTSLVAERESLEARVAELDTDDEIEAIARREYGLVMPGEEAYATLAGPDVEASTAAVFPFGDLFADLRDGEPAPD